MSPRFVLGRENVPCVAEVVYRSLKADCTDFTILALKLDKGRVLGGGNHPPPPPIEQKLTYFFNLEDDIQF